MAGAAVGLEFLGPPRLEYKSLSEPELRHQHLHGAGGYKGFPPGFTVDELVLYRRRRPPSYLRPQDNLRPEEGTLKAIKSEYRRRFLSYPFQNSDSRGKERRSRARPTDALRVEGDTFFKPEYRDNFVDFPRQRPPLHRPRTQLGIPRDVPMEGMTEKSAKYVEYASPKHALLTRKPTTLRYEGEFMETQSELHAKFVYFEGAKRAELTRRPTTLKMEGDVAIISEKHDKFVNFGSPSRRMIIRRQSNLRLEGEMDTMTEKNDKYITYPSPKKVPLRRRPTNLRLEGEMEKFTESNSKFVQYAPMKRPDLMKRLTNLQLEGEVEYLPEYKSMCVDFPRERPIVKRPACNLRTEGVFESSTEKRSQFLDFSSRHQRRDLQRPPSTFHLEDPSQTSVNREEDLARERLKFQKQDESTAKGGNSYPNYVQFSDSPRPNISRQHINLNLKSEMIFPDRRESCRDLTSERHPVKRPLPLKSCESSKKNPDQENPQFENKPVLQSGERCRNNEVKALEETNILEQTKVTNLPQTEPETVRVPVPQPPQPRRRQQPQTKNSELYKAFQVLDKDRPEKVVTFNLIGQRPRTRSVSQCSKDLATMRDPSPSYNTHVYNVDDNVHCSASPSTRCQENNNRQAFVVLKDDKYGRNGNNNNKRDANANLKKSPVSRSNLLDIPHGKGQSHQMKHINWMPPWYDAPTSI